MGFWMHRSCLIGFLAATVLVTGSLRAAEPVFSNQTGPAGVTMTHGTSGFANSNYTGGATIGDFNNDGWQDLFVFSGGNNGQPDRLFINNGNGTFSNEAASWGLTAVHKGKGATVADYNKDGWLDLFVTSAGPAGQSQQPGHHKLYLNNGDGTFTNVAAVAGVNFTNPNVQDGWGASFGDFDLDGDLDLIVGGSTPGNAGSKLFRNDGDDTFTDVTVEIGLFSGVPGIFGFSPSLVDMDGDRYPDIPFVGDFGSSRYFRNNTDGTFSEISNQANTAQEENGMGSTLGDFNNDGKLDWYVTSIYLPNINWTGNKIYRNVGNHSYGEFSEFAGVFDGGYGWGTVAIDFNHDGFLDIAETNGGGNGTFLNEQSYLWMNNGNHTFTEQAIASGLQHFGKGRCLINFDYDNDGDQDIVIASNNEPLFLFRNDVEGPDANWLRVFLDSSGDSSLAPNGFGARVFATAGELKMMRSVDGKVSHLGMSELSAHFGVGAAFVVDRVCVQWPNGTATTLADVDVNQTITISTTNKIGDLDGDGLVTLSDHAVFLDCMTGPQGGIDPCCVGADLDEDADVDAADFAAFTLVFDGV
ncbi:MAG: CRTAC1 family protein [Planctomycetes bacterium]|nr:CRTAC1 family protein [Planctomycetota bacterium]